MEILVRTEKHYWHFKGFRLFRKVTSWNWDKAIETVDALAAVQQEEDELQLDKLRKYTKVLEDDVEAGYLAAPVNALNWREHCAQASNWRKELDNTLPTNKEPWPVEPHAQVQPEDRIDPK